MADVNLGSLAGFTVVSNTVMAALEKRINSLSQYATLELSSALANGGETVTAHYVGSTVPTVTEKTSAGYVSSDMTLVPVSVSLGQPIYAQVEIDEVQLTKTENPLMLQDVVGGAIVKQLSKAIEDKAFNLITAGNYSGSVTAPLSGFNFAGYRNLVAAGFKAGFEQNIVALNSDYIAKLEAEAGYYARTSNGAFDDGSTLVRSDRIPTAGNLQGFITDKSGIVIAARTLLMPTDGIGSWAIKSSETGLSVRWNKYYDNKMGKSILKADLLVGAARGNPSGLIRVVSA